MIWLRRSINAPGSVSLYADDTALYHFGRDSAELKESALDGVASWLDNNRLKMNVKKDPSHVSRQKE